MVIANDELCKATTSTTDVSKQQFELNQNRPNPFKNTTVISYTLPNSGDVRFRVISVMGSVVLEEEHKNVQISFSKNYDFSHLSPGIYYYSIEFGGRMITKKMIIR